MSNDRIFAADRPALPSGERSLEINHPLSSPDALRILREITKTRAAEEPTELLPLTIHSGRWPNDTGQVVKRDCGTQWCTVNGIKYDSNLAIPGNEPVPLTHVSGRAVLGPDGKPVYGPNRANLDSIGDQFRQHGPLAGALHLATNFKHSGPYDFQRMQTDNGTLFTSQYRHFTNIAIGYAGAAAGIPSAAAFMANFYCAYKECKFSKSEQKSEKYPALPEVNVEDYRIGRHLWNERANWSDPFVSRSN